MNQNRQIIDLFPQPDDSPPPSPRERRTKKSPIEQYYLECQYCAVCTEWESDIWSWTAGVRELRALGWRRKNKRWVCPECSPLHCGHRQGDLWRCGICGEIREQDWGLLPVVGPDGWRHIACPDCRAECPKLVLATDGEMWCHYPTPTTDKDQGLPFGLAKWVDER